MPRFRLLSPLLALLLALAAPAGAAESGAVRSPRATATLVAEADAVEPGQPFRAGLRLRLAPGWHTYWKNAGDAGAAPELALSLPEGASAGPVEWPAPDRIPYGPLVNFGYKGEVLLPLAVTPPADLAPGGRFAIEAEATWLVCEQLCIPEEGRFRLELPVAAASPRPDPALAPLFAAAEAAKPRPSPWPARAGLGGNAGSLALAGGDFSTATVRDAFFFPETGGLIDNAAPQALSFRGGDLVLRLSRPEGAPGAAELAGVVALTDSAGRRTAYAVSAPVTGAVPEGAAPAADATALPRALALAFVGGLLLNLMPCVFPILAMKAMGLARLSGAALGEVRAHAASYTLGVLATFLLLGGALVGLRAAGAAAGWGFQFTAPAFVAAMAWLMLAVGLNLSGVFAVGGGAATGAGGSLARRGGHAGSFATGALAVLVATPCTAPFMAAAVAAAMAMPPAAALAVFAALGLGLAAPQALLGVFPGLARRLPRPGPWMERLRGALAFPMYGAAAWLAWVLSQQAGPEGLALLLAGAVLLGFAAWALGQAQREAGGGWRAARPAARAALLGAAALLPAL
ncbi:protein-disulfide reductase DsbD domain-containing protein, partial [Craurococcus roseus]